MSRKLFLVVMSIFLSYETVLFIVVLFAFDKVKNELERLRILSVKRRGSEDV